MVKIFLSYARADEQKVLEVYLRLQQIKDFQPWFDKKNLQPGQRWLREIEKAIPASDFVVIFFSRRSVNKRGGFQRELTLTLDVLKEIPPEHIHTIPVRLDDSEIPVEFREFQWLDLYNENGLDEENFQRLVQTIQTEFSQRQQVQRETRPEIVVDITRHEIHISQRIEEQTQRRRQVQWHNFPSPSLRNFVSMAALLMVLLLMPREVQQLSPQPEIGPFVFGVPPQLRQTEVAPVVSLVKYVIEAALKHRGGLKLKAHAENPTQEKIGPSLGRLAVARLLDGLPVEPSFLEAPVK